MKHCSTVCATFKAFTPITVVYGITKDVKVLSIQISDKQSMLVLKEIKKLSMESLFKESY